MKNTLHRGCWLLLLLACAPTEAEGPLQSTAAELCLPVTPAESDSNAIVSVFAGPLSVDSGSGPMLLGKWCSGVAVANNLVLTAMHCVTEHAPEVSGCQRDGSVPPNEGDGRARYGGPLDPELVSVFVGEYQGLRRTARAAAILTTGSPTRCRDDLAAIVLDCALPVTPTAVRMEPFTIAGEELRLVGYGRPRRREQSVRALGVSAEAARTDLPPRSLRTTGAACDGDSGGAMLSAETGALVGLVSHRTVEDCESPGAEAIGVHLAMYPDFVVRAARAAGARLRVEAHPLSLQSYQACTQSLLPSAADAGALRACGQ